MRNLIYRLNMFARKTVCFLLDHDWDYVDYSGDDDQHSYHQCKTCGAKENNPYY